MPFKINNRRYTGSKYKLVGWIDEIIKKNCINCHSFCDIFAGTGVVTESLINQFDVFYINDFLFSNEVIYKAFYKKENYDFTKITSYLDKYRQLNVLNVGSNYFSENFGGKFFELSDAKKIGFIRDDLEKEKFFLNDREFSILLASLIYSLDRCANTVGHYEAYCKNVRLRSSFNFELIDPTIKSENDNRMIYISREDSNELAKRIDSDIVYIDPPYSSRQYSRFYHILENITKWDKPKLYGVALKPNPENMSLYCSSKAVDAFSTLITSLNCKYIIVSYNNTYNSKSNSSKNKMSLEDIKNILKQKGKTKQCSIDFNAFNAGKTDLKGHKEILFVTEVKK